MPVRGVTEGFASEHSCLLADLAVDSHGMPVRLAVTEGTFADCSQALPLIEGIERSACWLTKPMTPMKS